MHAEVEQVRPRSSVRVLHGALVFVAVYAFQYVAGKAGWALADCFSYANVDPNGVFARLSVHHVGLLVLALAGIALLSRLTAEDFGLGLGDRRVGMRWVGIFTAVMAAIALVYHLLGRLGGQAVTYAYALNARNVLGSLGFQLLLSGPAEELLYRALPVTLLVYAFGQRTRIWGDVTLEVLLAALLFTAAHVVWSPAPFRVAQLDLFSLIYAFVMGVLNGVVLQKSRSVLYPLLMHSLSNVLMVGTGYLFAALF